MSIKIRNKRSVEFSMASMSDLVFLLLIFFILISTLVSPNVIPLLLPNSSSPNPIEVQTVTVEIGDQGQIYVKEAKRFVNSSELSGVLGANLAGKQKGNVVLRADKRIPVQNLVDVIDVVNDLNKERGTQYKVILATEGK